MNHRPGFNLAIHNTISQVRSAAVWTYHTRVAFVVSAVGGDIRDVSKLEKLNGLLRAVMDASGHSFVTILQVKVGRRCQVSGS